MIKLFLSCVLLFVFSWVFCQSDLELANNYFQRFEYHKAAEILNQAWEETPTSMNSDERKQLIYSNYVIGNFPAAKEPLEWLLNSNEIEPYFFFIKGEVDRALGFYESALEWYEKFEKTDGSIDMTMYKLSCLEAFTWGSLIVKENIPFWFNQNKATIICHQSAHGLVVLQEIGLDAKKRVLAKNETQQAEFFVLRPYLLEKDSLKPMIFSNLETHLSVSAISIHPTKDLALVAISNPLAKSSNEQIQRIFEASFNPSSLTFMLTDEWQPTKHTKVSVNMPTYHPKGNLVVFAQMDENLGTSNLMATYSVGDEWSEPQAISSINTDEDEMYPLFISDTLMSFASNGRVGYGGLDIYTAFFKNGKFEDIVHWLAPINSPKDDFSFYYNMQLDSAIYSTNRFSDFEDDNIFGIKFGEFVAYEEKELTEEEKEKNKKIQEFFDKWEKFIVYFDFDKFKLKENSKEVREMIAFLSDNQDYEIILTGHTDNRGPTKYNYKLGLKRAQSVKDKLLSIGVSNTQIQLTSKGKNDPLYDCNDGCKEKEHAKNRAVVIDVKRKVYVQ